MYNHTQATAVAIMEACVEALEELIPVMDIVEDNLRITHAGTFLNALSCYLSRV